MAEKTDRLPDDVVTEAVRNGTDDWLAELAKLDRTGIDHDTALRAVAAVKAELSGDA